MGDVASPSRVQVMRARDSGAPWPGRGHLLPAARLAQLRDLLADVDRVTGRVDRWDAEVTVDYAAAHGVLLAAWEVTLGALSHPGVGTVAFDGTVALLRAIKTFDDRIRDERLTQCEAAFQRVREALARLRGIDTTATLVAEAAVAVCSLGFDRAIVSRIEGGYWVPETVYVGRDTTWAEEILAIGRENPQRLDPSIVEYRMIDRGVAILVSDVQQLPTVHRPIADASMSRSYVAAPIIAHGNVIGFLHGDCYYQRRNLDETDREILAMFGEGLGYALARTAVLDRLAMIREDLAGLAAGTFAMPTASWSGLGRTPAGGEDGDGPGLLDAFLAPDGGETALTRREVDVLRRMAEGDTNARIARRLVISEGTVKSHVKHILRKLGAANRAEAATRWLQMERQGAPRPPPVPPDPPSAD